MKLIYAVIYGLGLGLASIFLHASIPPFGLLLSLVATGAGIWSIGRLWGGRSLRTIASLAWTVIVLRAGFPGVSDEYLIEGTAIGVSLINGGFLVLVLAILLPA
ncbi:unannotated protein [freshwater metagenome]|uniref:Unannotated protein n=1 Tax=freshwater metagenome TaxID=449393 RepID=A0A6J7LZG4_9ZZZZ|nr:hypothetical protein [Actinomycetota bacterium]MSW62772.1 hypothetical protein [Actinomycetota bacterium]MSX89860.1 hypothetical protein [Actinomycetota bacterium]MSZ63484.1 hypothetical protein [Actinomycetota bacterium]MTA58263.1 hypothetical protein [Actinomycetota bacterium]